MSKSYYRLIPLIYIDFKNLQNIIKSNITMYKIITHHKKWDLMQVLKIGSIFK